MPKKYNEDVEFGLGLSLVNSIRGVEPNLGAPNQAFTGIATKESFFAWAGDSMDLTNAYAKYQVYQDLVRLYDAAQDGNFFFLVVELTNFNGGGTSKFYFLMLHISWKNQGELDRNLLYELAIMLTEEPYEFIFDQAIWYDKPTREQRLSFNAEYLSFPIIEEPRRPTIFNSF